MRAHYLQHVPFEGLGSLEPRLRTAGYELTRTAFFESPTLPDPDSFDLLVIMGGPMSVNDEATLPWLVPEKRFVREVVERGTPVLGVCLGAQLVASALGAQVYRNRVTEIGWFPVDAVGQPSDTAVPLASRMRVFHWHGETFDLPPGARHIARNDACEHQGFQIGTSVVGLQFHLEMTPASVAAIIDHCGAEIRPSPYVQSADVMQAEGAETCRVMNDQAVRVIEWLTRSLAAPSTRSAPFVSSAASAAFPPVAR